MRVLLIDVNYGDSSTGKIVQDLQATVNADGGTATACYGRGEDRTDSVAGVFKFGLDWETYVHAALTRLTGYTGCFSHFSTRRLIKYIDEFQPDIIHIHELHAYFVNLKPLLTYIAKKGIPVVWTFHCEFMYTGKCGHAFDCNNWINGCGKCPSLGEYVSTFWFDHTREMLAEKKRLLDALDLRIVAPSQWLADRCRRSCLGDRPISVIHNGVDTSIFYPRDASKLREELGIGVDEKVVLALAPNLMDERKGGEFVLGLAGMNSERHVRFVIVGVENGTLPAEVPDNVIAKGPIYDKSLLATYYSMADAFVICSKRETFSMTCAEALCCGTRVFGFKSGAPESVFKEPLASFVEYGDTAALGRLLEDAEPTAAEEGRRRISEEAAALYSTKRMVAQYLKLYGEACSGAGQ